MTADLNEIEIQLACLGISLNPETLERLRSRYFNSVLADPANSVVYKISKEVSITERELFFYQNIPAELSSWFPRLVSSKIESHLAYIAIEMIDGEDLSKIYMRGETEAWEAIFAEINECLGSFQRLEVSGDSGVSLDRFVIDKTRRRILDFLSNTDPNFSQLLTSGKLEVNGQQVGDIEEVLATIERWASSLQSARSSFMHGDFCFNNMLWTGSGLFLIDPRGGMGGVLSNSGYVLYDVAKLAHSVVGGYDVILAGDFSCETRGNSLVYEINFPPNYGYVCGMFFDLCDNLSLSSADVLMLMGTLFLSMPPLHAEDPVRQKVMFAHGLSLCSQLLAQ